jgi:hypothetical protein
MLIDTSSLEEGFQIVLLYFPPDELLQSLRLEHLVRLLLSAEFDQESLIDPLQCGHLSMLRRIG